MCPQTTLIQNFQCFSRKCSLTGSFDVFYSWKCWRKSLENSCVKILARAGVEGLWRTTKRIQFKIGYVLPTCFSYDSFIRRYSSFFDTSWQEARLWKDARALSVLWTYLCWRQTTARTKWTLWIWHISSRNVESFRNCVWSDYNNNELYRSLALRNTGTFQCHHPTF